MSYLLSPYKAPAPEVVAAHAKTLLAEQGYAAREDLIGRCQEASVDLARTAGLNAAEAAEVGEEIAGLQRLIAELVATQAKLEAEGRSAYEAAALNAATAVYLSRGLTP
ncbi:hypothetical protein CcrSwift_gp041 [Caulobacter phage CcrSwift]|uniref:Uncharacterized protein n=1 Tax=Caulobacter phage CcrSwift TaxID=2927984 RepID=K4JSS4_9CAUD|nr:hypothetical protein D870_gp041 [Caulobacter phage CcrSwift]AFU88359.1 hypothetical protein CcrSwift_gp041 [Caulobacter phage CcrSwift]